MDGRVPTFAFSVDGISAEEAASRLGERGFAVWWGNYYALEVMKRLGLEDDGGAVRVGFVHYNTAEEVDRLLGGARRGSSDGAAAHGGRSRALVLVSTALRAWAALEVPVPWIAPGRDGLRPARARALWQHGSLDILGGPTPYYSLLTPLFAGFPLAAFGLDSGTTCCRSLQALAMSLAAVPVFLWARSLVPARSALLAAALAVAVPGLAYSGLVMTEVLFYPLLVLAAWAAAEALARRTLAGAAARGRRVPRRRGDAAAGDRPAARVCNGASGSTLAMARSWAGLRKLWPAAAGVRRAAARLARLAARLRRRPRSAATRSSPTRRTASAARRSTSSTTSPTC